MGFGQRRKCKCCHSLFRPDRRNRVRQHYCSAPACRAASKAASQARWLAKPDNRDYFRGPGNVARVRAWRHHGLDIPVSKQMAQQYVTAGSNAPSVLANLLLSPDPQNGNNPLLQLSPSSSIAMTASDNVRAQYAAAQMKALMGGTNPSGKAAVSFLGNQLNGFYSLDARQSFWQTSGLPYMKPYLQYLLEAVNNLPPRHNHPLRGPSNPI
jgi:hypothetical protein